MADLSEWDRYEKRSILTFESTKLLCENGEIPQLYVRELVREAQEALYQHKGIKHAVMSIKIVLEPMATPGAIKE